MAGLLPDGCTTVNEAIEAIILDRVNQERPYPVPNLLRYLVQRVEREAFKRGGQSLIDVLRHHPHLLKPPKDELPSL